jgi:hypothetical protein
MLSRARRQCCSFSLLFLLITCASAAELPREYLDTDLPVFSGRIIAVPAGGNLQAALQRAQRGDVIELQPGAVYTGPFELPAKKSGDGWILITTAGADKNLPLPGNRIGLQHKPAMAVLESAGGSVVTAENGAGYYRLTGIIIRPRPGHYLTNLISLGSETRNRNLLPHHITIDRCIVHGDPLLGARRGLAMNSSHTAVIDSYFSDFMEIDADSQAIAGWNGPGPFKIVNNYLEGAGENIMFGGADSLIRQLVPADIEIRYNHFYKPLRWKIGHPEYAGTPWTVKNLFELKNARRVLLEGNLLEHNWLHAQAGFAVLLTVRTEDGRMPWAVVEDVTITNNVIRHAGNGINLLGRDDGRRPGGQTRRILIANNIFEDIGGEWGGGRLFQLLNGTEDVVIRNNSAWQTDSIIMSDGAPHHRFVFEGNVAPHNRYGITGAGSQSGKPSLERHFPGALVQNNVIAGGRHGAYPAGNQFPRSLTAAEKKAGQGVDLNALCSAVKQALPAFPLISQCREY